MVALTVASGAAAASVAQCASATCGQDPAKVSFTGIYLGQAVVAVAGVLAVGDEYSTGMVSRHLQQIGPLPAGLDVQATTGIKSLPLTPWQGLGVVALWTAGALLLGALVLRFRDA
ncbi:MAG TPA: hypothetical protein VGS06_21505 [Streptosporangiaceae bacterium]|nr:hypothetical protein [Streptosporangiaceae bacterium]